MFRQAVKNLLRQLRNLSDVQVLQDSLARSKPESLRHDLSSNELQRSTSNIRVSLARLSISEQELMNLFEAISEETFAVYNDLEDNKKKRRENGKFGELSDGSRRKKTPRELLLRASGWPTNNGTNNGTLSKPYESQLGLHYQMEIHRPILANFSDFLRFQSPEYLQFLASLTPMTRRSDPSVSRFFDRDVERLTRIGPDPISHGLFDYCRAYAGCSLSAAAKLNRQEADIAINWTGGMHRAKSDMASGFCFVNDIVLAIIELLKVFKRVLYVDIGFRHGDGVEQAFYNTDRVMTLSFHTFRDDFFPRNYRDRRELYSLNAPLKDCLGDLSLGHLFRPVIHKAMEVYQPEVIVLQCGADSLAADMSGTFNLRSKGHGDCLQYIRSFNVPLLVLGGGGTMNRHVARCWFYETAVAVGLGAQFEEVLFANEFFIKRDRIPDLNTSRDIITIRDILLQQLSQVIHVPSVQFQDTPSISEAIEPAEVDLDKRQTLRNLKRSKL